MADFLQTILERKKLEVETAKRSVSEEWLMGAAAQQKDSKRAFFEKLAVPGPSGANIIAEIKRASPSRGVIRSGVSPREFAMAYEEGGAAAISVLTDATFFKGSPEDLQAARLVSSLPVLRKDFVVTSYQVVESAAMGADAVLLIVRALSSAQLREYLDLAVRLGMDALVEVHSEAELEEATRAGARLIGINNRDLTTFNTDIATSKELAGKLAPGQVAVAASGIERRDDVESLLDHGIWNFLIGESIMRSGDPAGFIRRLLGESQ